MKKLKQIIKHQAFQNIGFLTIANVISQIIALIGSFYIPKLLGPEQYGVYNTVTAYVALFTVFTFSGLSKVIIREASKDTNELKNIIESTIGLRHLFSLFAVLLTIIIAFFLGYELVVKYYILLYAFTLLFKGLHNSSNNIFQATQQMKPIGVISVLRQLVRVPITILLLYLGKGVLSILFVHLGIEIIATIILYRQSKKIITFNIFSKVKLLMNYIKPGLRFSLLEFLNILSGKIDLVMLSFLTTPQNVGIYALAYRLVDKGLVLRAPISQALFPYYSKKYKEGKPQLSLLVKHTLIIFSPMLILLIPAIFLIEPFIINVIGVEFIQSAGIFVVLVFYLVLNFSIIPWGLALQTTSNEKYAIYTTTTIAVVNICLNLLFFKFYGIIGIAYSTLFVEGIRFVLNTYFAKKHVF